jgi:hypothetical protein
MKISIFSSKIQKRQILIIVMGMKILTRARELRFTKTMTNFQS